MKTRWCFSTVMLFLLYMTAIAFGGALTYIIRGLREGQTDFQLWFLALASLLLSLAIILRSREV